MQSERERCEFQGAEEALTFAKEVVEKKARVAAVEAGAVGPQVIVDVARDGGVFRVVAKAFGNPRL